MWSNVSDIYEVNLLIFKEDNSGSIPFEIAVEMVDKLFVINSGKGQGVLFENGSVQFQGKEVTESVLKNYEQ